MTPKANFGRQEGDPATRFAGVYEVLREAIAARAFPGCAFGVLAGGEVVLESALGRFTYDETSPAVSPETLYDVASLTKVVATTATAMLLHQRGRLDLDTHAGELLPGFIVGRPDARLARRVTLRHLLAHSSGLPGYVDFYKTASTPGALYRALMEVPLVAEPGTRAEYSDPGFILLGKALEVLLREELAAWVGREALTPLGLAATRYMPPAGARAAIPPTEEDKTFRHRVLQGEVQDENAFVLKGVSGHAGLFSNVPDLLRFSAAILGAGLPGNEISSLFTAATVELFAERQGPEGSSRALGWDTPSENSSAGTMFSQHSIGHLGYSGCSLWIDLDAGVAAVLLTNRTWPDRSGPDGSGQRIRQVRPAFHDAVRRSLAIP